MCLNCSICQITTKLPNEVNKNYVPPVDVLLALSPATFQHSVLLLT